jgi:hypothetical protein
MQLQLVTLSGSKFDEDVYEVVIPTVDGEIGVFPWPRATGDARPHGRHTGTSQVHRPAR